MSSSIAAILTIVALLVLTGVLSLLDRRLYGTWLTPFVLLAGPYTVVVLLAFSIGPSLGFVPLYTPSVLIWLMGLAAFWGGGRVAALPLLHTRPQRAQRLQLFPQYEERSQKPALLLSWLGVLVLGVSAVRLLLTMGGLAALGTDAFTAVYNSGLTGHLFAVTQLLLVFWIGSLRRLQALHLVTLAAMLAVNMLYQGKGALMIPVVAGIVYRLLAGRLRLGWRSVIFVGIAGYLMFNAIYLLTFSTSNPAAMFNLEAFGDLFYHFWAFLFAGVLGWSDLVRFGVDVSAPPSFLVEPWLNLGAVALRHELLAGRVTGYDYMLISPWHGKVTNVMTMFGVMQVALGTVGTVLAATIMGAGYYALFVVATRVRNCWLVVCYSFCAAVLCFGWFSYFYSLLTYIEIPVLGLIFALCAGLANKRIILRRGEMKLQSRP